MPACWNGCASQSVRNDEGRRAHPIASSCAEDAKPKPSNTLSRVALPVGPLSLIAFRAR